MRKKAEEVKIRDGGSAFIKEEKGEEINHESRQRKGQPRSKRTGKAAGGRDSTALLSSPTARTELLFLHSNNTLKSRSGD